MSETQETRVEVKGKFGEVKEIFEEVKKKDKLG